MLCSNYWLTGQASKNWSQGSVCVKSNVLAALAAAAVFSFFNYLRGNSEFETPHGSGFSIVCRLSEPNMASISGQLEELYMAHSRKDMNDTLTGVLLSACAPGMAVPARLVMEHMLLVSILHRTVGVEVGL